MSTQRRLEDEVRFGGVPRDPVGAYGRDGFLPVSSPLRRICTPTTIAFAGGRAILMELAHPAVAQAVEDFDHFRTDPTRRAQLTVMAMARAIHGSAEAADGVGRHLQKVHARVRGEGYEASDPALQLWVHATFVDSLLRVAAPLGRRLSPADRELAHRDSVRLGEAFGISAAQQPASLAAHEAYIAATVASLEVGEVGRSLARSVFHPSLPRSREPLAALYRAVCFGTLPDGLREQFAGIGPASPPWWLRAATPLAPVLGRTADGAIRLLNRRGGVTSSVLLRRIGIRPEQR